VKLKTLKHDRAPTARHASCARRQRPATGERRGIWWRLQEVERRQGRCRHPQGRRRARLLPMSQPPAKQRPSPEGLGRGRRAKRQHPRSVAGPERRGDPCPGAPTPSSSPAPPTGLAIPGRPARAFWLGLSFPGSARVELGPPRYMDRAEFVLLDRSRLGPSLDRLGPARLARPTFFLEINT
jgi:hypothetical protein